MWKCFDAELQRQICCFPYAELSDVPRLQQVGKKSCRTAEESLTVTIYAAALLIFLDRFFAGQSASPAVEGLRFI
jgi:hypothetical protein